MNDFTSRKLLEILSEMSREMARIRRALEVMVQHDIQRDSGGDTEPESHHGNN